MPRLSGSAAISVSLQLHVILVKYYCPKLRRSPSPAARNCNWVLHFRLHFCTKTGRCATAEENALLVKKKAPHTNSIISLRFVFFALECSRPSPAMLSAEKRAELSEAALSRSEAGRVRLRQALAEQRSASEARTLEIERQLLATQKQLREAEGGTRDGGQETALTEEQLDALRKQIEAAMEEEKRAATIKELEAQSVLLGSAHTFHVQQQRFHDRLQVRSMPCRRAAMHRACVHVGTPLTMPCEWLSHTHAADQPTMPLSLVLRPVTGRSSSRRSIARSGSERPTSRCCSSGCSNSQTSSMLAN